MKVQDMAKVKNQQGKMDYLIIGIGTTGQPSIKIKLGSISHSLYRDKCQVDQKFICKNYVLKTVCRCFTKCLHIPFHLLQLLQNKQKGFHWICSSGQPSEKSCQSKMGFPGTHPLPRPGSALGFDQRQNRKIQVLKKKELDQID